MAVKPMNEQVNFAIVGCGRISDLHAHGYKMSEKANLIAICDLDKDRLAHKSAKWGIDSDMLFTDIDELLRLDNLHAVDILLPHDLHEKVTRKAAEAKKDVSVQKPMALEFRQCQNMIDICHDNEVKLRVFENFRFYPPYIKAKEIIESGEIGRPSFIHIKLGASLGGGWEVPLDAWMWRFDQDRCGGGPLVWDDGYHKFSIAEFLLGDVQKVKAWIDETGVYDDDQEAPIVVDSPAAVMWKYKRPRTYGTMDVTWSREGEFPSDFYPADERVEITGDKGYIWVNQCTAKSLRKDSPVVTFIEGKLREFDEIDSGWQSSFDAAVDHFADCILNDTEPILSGQKGLEIQKFATAAHLSAEKGTEISLDDI